LKGVYKRLLELDAEIVATVTGKMVVLSGELQDKVELLRRWSHRYQGFQASICFFQILFRIFIPVKFQKIDWQQL